MWKMLLHLQVNQKHDDDDDDFVFIETLGLINNFFDSLLYILYLMECNLLA